MDKTQFIRDELKRMLLNKEVSEHLCNQIEKIVEYLTYNNIFNLEKREWIENCLPEVLEILIKARESYWKLKNNDYI